MTDSSARLARLRQRLDRLSRRERPTHGMFGFGCVALDVRLEGGLARGALHEICGSNGDTATAAFALMMTGRAAAGKPVLWVTEDKVVQKQGHLYGPGLVELGIDPDLLTLVQAPDTLAALRAGADAIRCAGLGAVVIEPAGAARALDLTASRKLVLAAEASGIAAFVLREGESVFASAAATRWRVASAPSAPLEADAPGHPALAVELVRHRGGIAPFSCILEWNRDTRSFAPLSGAVPAAAVSRPLAA